jgi:hypothetical protein
MITGSPGAAGAGSSNGGVSAGAEREGLPGAEFELAPDPVRGCAPETLVHKAPATACTCASMLAEP